MISRHFFVLSNKTLENIIFQINSERKEIKDTKMVSTKSDLLSSRSFS